MSRRIPPSFSRIPVTFASAVARSKRRRRRSRRSLKPTGQASVRREASIAGNRSRPMPWLCQQWHSPHFWYPLRWSHPQLPRPSPIRRRRFALRLETNPLFPVHRLRIGDQVGTPQVVGIEEAEEPGQDHHVGNSSAAPKPDRCLNPPVAGEYSPGANWSRDHADASRP